MEVRALSLRVTQEELNDWIERWMKTSKLRGLTVTVAAGGMTARGEGYLLGMWLPFEADVEVGVDGAFVALRLANLRAGGAIPVPVNWIAPQLAKIEREWLCVQDDTLVINGELLLQSLKLNVKLNLSNVRCEPGALVLDAQAPEARTPPAP